MPVNRFVAALSPEDAAALQPHLRQRRLDRDHVVATEGAPIERAILPLNGVLSVVAVMRDGRQVETRTIGCEGGFGLLHALGSPISFERVATQIAGDAHELPLSILAQAAGERPAVRSLLVSFAQASLIQSSQTTACNALHTTEQRLCRWLLMTRDRLDSNVLPLTHEHLSVMLGVQRTTVTAIASALQARQIIAYSRGKILITDRRSLAAIACECYAAIDQGIEQTIAAAADGRRSS